MTENAASVRTTNLSRVLPFTGPERFVDQEDASVVLEVNRVCRSLRHHVGIVPMEQDIQLRVHPRERRIACRPLFSATTSWREDSHGGAHHREKQAHEARFPLAGGRQREKRAPTE